MKIRVTTIPPTGLSFSDKMPKELINERLSSPSESEIIFIDDVTVDGIIKPFPGGAELKATTKSKYTQPCARCAEGKERQLETPLKAVIKPKPESVLDDEDIGVIYYSGEHVELDEFILESLILSLSIFWAPEIEEKTGKCKECKLTSKELGLSEPEKTSNLGDLLKKAGVK